MGRQWVVLWYLASGQSGLKGPTDLFTYLAPWQGPQKAELTLFFLIQSQDLSRGWLNLNGRSGLQEAKAEADTSLKDQVPNGCCFCHFPLVKGVTGQPGFEGWGVRFHFSVRKVSRIFSEPQPALCPQIIQLLPRRPSKSHPNMALVQSPGSHFSKPKSHLNAPRFW